MTNIENVRRTLERAGIILDEARSLRTRGAWNLVVRRCQEVVELALKGALSWAGLEVPRIHDVGAVLQQYTDRFPQTFTEATPKMMSISRDLRAERETSFYGDEESGLPPEMLYDETDAEDALQQADSVLQTCRLLLEESVKPASDQPGEERGSR